MQDTKRAVHTLYEVTRNGDFINDMSHIIRMATNKQDQVMFLVHSGDVESLSQFLLAYMDEIDLSTFDKNGLNVWYVLDQFL